MRKSAKLWKISKMNRKLYELIHFFKFSIVGLLGMVISTAIFFSITSRLPENVSIFEYLPPYLISVEAGIVVTFFPNDRWVFKKEKKKLSTFHRFLGYHGTLFGGFVVQTFLFLFLLLVHINYYIAYVGGLGAAALWNYIISRKAIFA